MKTVEKKPGGVYVAVHYRTMWADVRMARIVDVISLGENVVLLDTLFIEERSYSLFLAHGQIGWVGDAWGYQGDSFEPVV